MGTEAVEDSIERIVVLVVHGVGEQCCFEQVEAVAANFYKALQYHRREPIMQVHIGDQQLHGAPANVWREPPVTIRWRKNEDAHKTGDKKKTSKPQWMEATFREVYWADLDVPMNFRNWWRFVGWALSVPGVRFFAKTWPGLRAPRELPRRRQLAVRAKLFLLSLFFLILLGSVGLLDFVLKRLALRINWIERSYRLFFDYLGDIKLYQDWFLREEERCEIVGEKARVGVRRRMVRALLQTASQAAADESISGFYIFAHSLGTVIAYNALMEPEQTLPNYLTEREWRDLHAALKKTVPRLEAGFDDLERPRRRPWLDAGGHWVVDRTALFRKFRGLLTAGSPIDRFAAIWPALVPINTQGPKTAVPWINVYDVQDPVAGGDIELVCADGKPMGGLACPVNYPWPDQRWFFFAHTSYWQARKGADRLIDSAVRWLEGRPFALALDGNIARAKVYAKRAWYLLTGAAVSAVLLLFFGTLVRLGTKAIRPLLAHDDWSRPLAEWLQANFIAGAYTQNIPFIIACAAALGVAVILTCSFIRWLWESIKFGKKPALIVPPSASPAPPLKV